MMHSSSHKRSLLIIACTLLAVGLGVLLFRPASSEQISVSSGSVAQIPESKTVTLTGRYGCLPKRDTGGVQTMECALGMLADDGESYILDSETTTGLEEMLGGGTFQIEGTFTPIEMLSTDQWRTYDVRGIVQVKSWNKL